MIELKKKENISIKKLLLGLIITSFVTFSGYCIYQAYLYGSLSTNLVKYEIVQDQVYAKFNDGKHKSWDLKALAENQQNHNMYWIDVTPPDLKRGYKEIYGSKIIPPNSGFNETYANIGVMLVIIIISLIIALLLFFPLWFDDVAEYFTKKKGE